ncbi:MAG: 23S rRNA (uracil(1939)-C(5))-methyltransferase RlmD [Gammaproteobacteria bacterium]|nr:MAG: 23S rRNA (uracil(1939)-C(5))-methyltransferase RlmD [Gammaproteobacteria bacterium]
MSRRHAGKKTKNWPPAEAVIESVTLEGNGVAHIDGKAVFISGAIPGERVMFTYTQRKSRFDEGRVTEVLEASAERVEPRCVHYGVCGACSWQHIKPEAQIRYKQQAMLDTIRRVGKVEPEVVFEPLVAESWAYRRKARLGVRYVRKQDRVLVGFRGSDGRSLADMQRCEILHPTLGEHLVDFQELIAGLDARAAIPQIETAVGDNGTALVFRHMEPLSQSDQLALRRFGEQHDYQIYLQPGGPDSVHCIWPDNPELYYQHPEFNTRVDFGPQDFFQINQSLNRKMVVRAVELLDPQPEDKVLDLFCGLGNFTLPLAIKAGHVTGVEGDSVMVRRARETALANGIENTDYFVCNLMGKMQGESWLKQRFDKILLDPPRAGAKEVIEHFGRLGAKRIVYVSCHPGTLARDADMLVNTQGYRLVGAGVLDMFPHTAHVESIAVFEK